MVPQQVFGLSLAAQPAVWHGPSDRV